jgi:hypothetical protein
MRMADGKGKVLFKQKGYSGWGDFPVGPED